MVVKRVRRLLATAALILFVPGGASTALADVEPAADDGPRAAALQQTPTTTAAQRHRRAEAAWLAEQMHAARRVRSGTGGEATPREPYARDGDGHAGGQGGYRAPAGPR